MGLPHASRGRVVSATKQSSAVRSQSSGKLRLVLPTATSVRLGEPNGYRFDSCGWICPTGHKQDQSAGWARVFVLLLFLQSACALLCSLSSIWVRCCTVHTTSCQIDQTIALSVFNSISKLVVSRPRGVHDAAWSRKGRDGYQRLERERKRASCGNDEQEEDGRGGEKTE